MEYAVDCNRRTNASISRFQRLTIAVLSFIAVLSGSPIPSLFIVITSIIVLMWSPRFELISIFYRKVIKKILGRDLFRFEDICTGPFLLEEDIERFLFKVYALANILALTLYYIGVSWWIVPVAVVATGTILSATTGICFVAYIYGMAITLRRKGNAND